MARPRSLTERQEEMIYIRAQGLVGGAPPETHEALAAEFKVSISTVYRVIARHKAEANAAVAAIAA